MSTPEESALEHKKQRSLGYPVNAPDLLAAHLVRKDIAQVTRETREDFRLGNVGDIRPRPMPQNGTEAIYATLPRNGQMMNESQIYTAYLDAAQVYTTATIAQPVLWTYTVPTGRVMYIREIQITPQYMVDIALLTTSYAVPGTLYYVNVLVNGSITQFNQRVLLQPLDGAMQTEIIAGPGETVQIKLEPVAPTANPAAFWLKGIARVRADMLACNDNSVPYTALRP